MFRKRSASTFDAPGPFVDLVDRILAAKGADAGAATEVRERAIDRLVYDLYGLTAEESAAASVFSVAPG